MGFRAKLSAKVTWVSTFLLLFFSPKMAKTQMAGCSFQGLGLEQCLNQGKNSISIDQSCCIVLNQAVQAGFHCLCLLLASHNPPLSTPLVFPLSSNCFISAPPLTQCQGKSYIFIMLQSTLENNICVHGLCLYIDLVPVLQPPVPPLQPLVTPALQPPVPPALPVLLPPDIPQEPPVTPALPVLTPPHFLQEPPVTPALPVLLPPDIPQEPLQPSAPNAFLLPPPPPELPLKSTSDKNSTTLAMQPSLNNNSAPDLSTFKSGYLWISEGRKKTISFQSRLSMAATLCACMI
ncbi:hypothetical protein RHGRI_003458 [Rhododendron griersonianum]|uniref:Bifunctional inhibitor/plant lipid transfer protein/seed storage helical domain-containing protein n=1 Tax=Rhododendron griersonianum TaxID=479676 RepID=A0AAV6L5T4_9ERIC|nr:hypothetical protein RHGRI_003458 [Rhododendron griersonianum]